MWNKTFYKDLMFYVHEEVYEPREDSFLLADNQGVEANDFVLDLGTGCGIQGIVAAQKAEKVVSVDLNPHAEENLRKNAELHKVSDKIEFRLGNLFEKVDEKFDLILFNPPYLPKEGESEKWIDHSYNSSEVLKEFLTEYKKYLKPDGKCVIINSSLSGVDVGGEILASEKLDFEELFVVKLS